MIYHWIDYTIFGITALSVLIGLVRGFVRESFALVSWLLSLWVGFYFYKDLALRLQALIRSDTLRLLVSFASLFLGSLLLGALFNSCINRLMAKAGLGGIDRLLGGCFGLVRGVLVVSLLFMLGQLTPLPKNPEWRESILLPYFYPVEQWLRALLPRLLTENESPKQTPSGITVDF